MRDILKVILLIALGAYLVGPLYLYGFTPAGVAVLNLVHQTQQGGKLPEPLASLAKPVFSAKSDDAGETQPSSTPAKDPPISVLLLGYGGPGQEGPYLTDSIVLAIADSKSKTLSLLSIPRDTYLKLPLGGEAGTWSKINTAYAYGVDDSFYSRRPDRYKGDDGGGNLAKDAVSTVVGFPVRYYLALDFRSFRQLIDEVGGIDVTVPASFSSLYPDEDVPLEDRDYKIVRFEAGKQHYNGARALEYSRARQAIDNLAEGSDFARSRRQRQVMQAFKDKVMSPGGLIHLPALLGIAKQRIRTDLEVPGLGDLQRLLTDWRGAKISEAALTSENYLTSAASTEAAYVLSPVPGQSDWTQIHAFVRVLMEEPELAEEMARTKVIVRNGSGRPEKGKELRAKLMLQGFAVAPVETAPLQATTRIEDMTEGQANHLIDSLKEALGKADLPVQNAGFPSLRVAIVLGQD